MPENWKSYKLGQILGKRGYIRGPFGSALKRPEMQTSGIPVYEQQHAIYNHREFRYFINERKFNELSRFQVQTDDLIISCSGTIGRISLISQNDEKGIISQALLLLRPDTKIIKSLFLKYFFLTPYGFDQLIQASYGSVQANIAKRAVVEEIPVSIPDLDEQERIISILSALDENIELNLEMNRTLENIAQATFKHWFVDFKFPGFDGELVDGLPKGWKKAGIGEIISVQNGYAFKSSDFKAHGNNGVIKIKNISNNVVDIENMQFVDENIANIVAERFRISGGDLLIAMTGAEVGKVGIVPKTEKYLWLNQRVGSFKEKIGFAKWFVYLILSTNEYQNVLLNSARGSAQPNISSSQIERVESTIPTENLIKQFGELVNPFFERICENYFENQILTQIRNGLLPKLMSGKIRVAE